MKSSENRRDWVHILFLGGLHGAALLGFYYTPRTIDLALFVGMYLLTGFGVTIGYHRLLTHRGFECSRWLRRTFGALGAASLEGGPIVWVGTHRRHHAYSDLESDPHTPKDGLFWSHIGWIFAHRDKSIDRKRAMDLARDPFFRWMDRNHFFVWVASLAVCYAIAGWGGVLWGGVIRTVWTWNVTWSVNSFCHVFGSRSYDTPEGSRNLWWVGLFALGEGWHNNHHAHQRSAIAGETVWQIDLAGYVVRLLERLGLIWEVNRAPALHRITPRSIAKHLRTREGAERVLAVESLRAFHGSAAVMDLIRALEDESASYRARAAEVLGRIGDSRAVDPLISRLYDSADSVRREAVIALGRLTPTEASIDALRRFRDECRDEVAEAARKALAQLEASFRVLGVEC